MEHGGQGCPLPVGTVFEGKYEWLPGKFMMDIQTVKSEMPAWDWRNWGCIAPCGRKQSILRIFRVRKPRALRDLITIAADPYAPPPVIGPDGPVRLPEGVPA